ncbi:hypothetical protein AAGG74_16105 [Bacillus mexicanus]|uniref:hypothetical protein n=1 Tax=Bacillus mexicanus TaxID=2834415 RepID=UPI003D211672
MNKEKLFSLMPKEVVKEEVSKKIEEQRGIVSAGKRYVSHLSINRYLSKQLSDFDIEEIIDLFDVIRCAGFIINENQFNFDLDIESFAAILEYDFNLDDMYELDNVYIENLLNGRDITKEVIKVNDEKMSFADVLLRFVFQSMGVFMGDTPPLMRMLVVKKALLGTYLAEKNVESLLKGEREIYDISILM